MSASTWAHFLFTCTYFSSSTYMLLAEHACVQIASSPVDNGARVIGTSAFSLLHTSISHMSQVYLDYSSEVHDSM